MKLNRKQKIILWGCLGLMFLISTTICVNRYIGELSCKIKSDVSILGITIFSYEGRNPSAEYLASFVGDINSEETLWYNKQNIYGFGRGIQTPPGNWFNVGILKMLEDNGLDHEVAVSVAQKLVSDSEATRKAGEKQLNDLWEKNRSD